MANQSVPNAYFTRRSGVKVYHLHRDDRRDETVLDYHYTMRAYGTFDDNGAFDVRDLKVKLAGVTKKPLPADMSHSAVIKAAIDAKLIGTD